MACLSGGRGGATERRADHLRIRHGQVGANDKPAALSRLAQTLQLEAAEIAFVGDDLNDLAVRGQVGVLVATADEAQALRRQADLVLSRPGGNGAGA